MSAPTQATLDVVVLVGSLRVDSWNHQVAQALTGLGVDDVRLDVLRADLPLYDGDFDRPETESEATPKEVVAMRQRVGAADGLVIVTPEFNFGVPGPLKNTLDWLSRPAYRSVLRDKAVTSIGASPGPSGASRAVAQLNATLVGVAAAILPWPALTIAHVNDVMVDGCLEDKTAQRARRQIEAFTQWIPAVEAYKVAHSTT